MIREMQAGDIGRVMEIWLKENTEAHRFIDAQYWKGHFEMVREMLPQAEVYVSQNGGCVNGFIGLNGGYIEGIFVSGNAQSRRIGRQLMEHAKRLRGQLSLSVYQKNESAIRFYRREGFRIERAGVDEETGEPEFTMVWMRKAAQR